MATSMPSSVPPLRPWQQFVLTETHCMRVCSRWQWKSKITQLPTRCPVAAELPPAAALDVMEPGSVGPAAAGQPCVAACDAGSAGGGGSAAPGVPAPPPVGLWTGPPDAGLPGAGVPAGCCAAGTQGTCTEQGHRPTHSPGCCSGGERRLRHRTQKPSQEVANCGTQKPEVMLAAVGPETQPPLRRYCS